jgi:hypothetical protein
VDRYLAIYLAVTSVGRAELSLYIHRYIDTYIHRYTDTNIDAKIHIYIDAQYVMSKPIETNIHISPVLIYEKNN